MVKLMIIALGGAIGTVLRHFLSGVVYRLSDGVFPWGTLLVNLVGALIFGIIWAVSEKFVISSSMRSFIFVGILGAFTTFSTYTFETFSFLRDAELKLAFANIIASNILGILLVFMGFLGTKYFLTLLAGR